MYLIDHSDLSHRFMVGSEILFSYQNINLTAVGNDLRVREAEGKKKINWKKTGARWTRLLIMLVVLVI